jgi:lipoprotein-anchoring transpeptidase ErfK/SrfK
MTLGACTTTVANVSGPLAYAPEEGGTAMLVAATDEPFPVTPVPVSAIPRQFRRQIVSDPTGEAPGTVVVDPRQRFLYLVEEAGMARRYGIGVGREGFAWAGTAIVGAKREWPKWFPPPEMQERDPRAREFANGMDGGPTNPLGARALYLYQNGVDTLFRIHGTPEYQSIGQAVSSGCIRMLNVDVIDLYNRVPLQTRVVVLGATSSVADATQAGDPDALWRAEIRQIAAQPPA